jgi:hypothetical protein
LRKYPVIRGNKCKSWANSEHCFCTFGSNDFTMNRLQLAIQCGFALEWWMKRENRGREISPLVIVGGDRFSNDVVVHRFGLLWLCRLNLGSPGWSRGDRNLRLGHGLR